MLPAALESLAISETVKLQPNGLVYLRFEFDSILFCTFMALNLCQEDSKTQH